MIRRLLIHLMLAEEQVRQSGKYYSAQTVYDHSRRRQSHLYIPYAVCNVGCKMKLRYFLRQQGQQVYPQVSP